MKISCWNKTILCLRQIRFRDFGKWLQNTLIFALNNGNLGRKEQINREIDKLLINTKQNIKNKYMTDSFRYVGQWDAS